MRRKMMLLASVLAVGGVVLAEEGKVALPESFIVESTLGDEVFSTPKNITVITSSEIADSGAKTVAEALKSVPGLTIHSMGGKDPSFDLRGQGDTAGSNVLVLLDGVPINSIDLSGYRTSRIPIDMVERIEIIPSGGGVVYGDGAVGGIINITTKKPMDRVNYGKIGAEMGSYDYRGFFGNFGTKVGENTLLDINYTRKDQNGYRRKAKNDYEDVDIKVTHLIDGGSLDFKYSYSENDFSAPGALDENDATNNPTKPGSVIAGTNRYNIYNISLKKELVDNLEFGVSGDYRTQEYRTGYDYDTKIGYVRSYLKYIYMPESYLMAGGDFQKGETEILKYTMEKENVTNKRESLGGFIHNKVTWNQFSFTQGYRRQNIELDNVKLVGYFPQRVERVKKTLKEDAVEFTAAYNYRERGMLWASYTTGFRTPNTDELNPEYWSGGVKAQTNRNYEIGIKENLGNTYISASIFLIDTENEIFYDMVSNKNRNLEGKNRRKGGEISLEQYFDRLTLKESYSYISTEVLDGTYKGKHIPGVPSSKFSLSGTYQATDSLRANLNINYNGTSYYSSDFMNYGKKLDAYITVDTKISYDFKNGLEIYGGINNLFNKTYYDYASNYGMEFWGTVYNFYNYYPANKRNFYGGFKYSF